MQPSEMTESNDLKALVRALEDRLEAQAQLQLQKILMEKDIETYKELINNEEEHNVRLKESLKWLEDSTEGDSEKLNAIRDLRQAFHKSSLTKVLSFSEQRVAEFRESRMEKEAGMKNKFKEHVNEYAKSHPKVLEYLNNSDELERLETQLKSLLEEKRIFAEKAEKERQFKKMVLQQNIVELAELVLRYNNCIEKMKNPGKKGSVMAHPRMMMNLAKFQRRSKSQYKPVPKSNENPIDDPQIPETVASSKHQETIDTNVEDQACSSREIKSKPTEPKMNQRNEIAGSEEPAEPKVPNTPSVMKNATDDNKEKGRDVAKQTKDLMPNVSSLKRAKEATNCSSNYQSSKKSKVTFVDFDSSSSNIEEDFNRDEGVTSSNSKDATNDIEIEKPLENDNGLHMDGDNEANDSLEDNGANNQMDDDENNFDLDSDLNIDENDGNISTWTSLETGRNNTNAGSPGSSSFFDDFVPFQKSDNNSKPTSNSPFDMNYSPDEMDAEMGNFFKDF